MQLGPKTREQVARFGREWKQGEHVLVTGDTGSGKSTLAAQLANEHAKRGAFTVVMVCKLQPDKTIVNEYKGWTRWQRMKKRPSAWENRILLWPKTDNVPARRARIIQREVFREMFDVLSVVGKWTLLVDEGLYVCDSELLNLGNDLKLAHQVGRSSGLSILTCTQRPSHLPLVVYSSASHAFIGRNNIQADAKRLGEVSSRDDPRAVQQRIQRLGKHDFLWIARDGDRDPELVNMSL